MLIRRSLVAFVVFAVVYAVLLPATHIPGFKRGSQWELNVMSAEAFAYESPNPDVVVVGSSISYWLKDLPDDWYNLALTGEGALTGLTIVDQSNDLPQTVLIELNMIDKPVNERLVSGLFGPGVRQAKQLAPMLRERNEPSHVALRCLHLADYYAGRVAEKLGMTHDPAAEPVQASAHPPNLGNSNKESGGELLRALRYEAVKTEYDPAELADRLRAVRALVESLESRGVRVVLFEAPEDEKTYDSPRRTQLRELAHAELPPDRFAYLQDPIGQTFATRDGVHMTAESATRYCHWLRTQVSGAGSLVSVWVGGRRP